MSVRFGRPAPGIKPSHCTKGHRFTPANTWEIRGHRHCRECHRERNGEFMRQQRHEERRLTEVQQRVFTQLREAGFSKQAALRELRGGQPDGPVMWRCDCGQVTTAGPVCARCKNEEAA